MYIYGIVVIICIYILYFGYYKLKSPFWSRQPVFHYHNIWYWLFPCGILKPNLTTSKYLDKNVSVECIDRNNFMQNNKERKKTETISGDNIEDVNGDVVQIHIDINKAFKMDTMKKCVQLIQNQYLNDGKNQYNPELGEISSYFYGHQIPCFIGYYNKTIPLIQNGNIRDVVSYNKLVSTITSRPIYFKIQNDVGYAKSGKSIQFTTQYVDFLVTHKSYRKQGITPKLIYSFAHTIINNRQYQTTNFLFKNEGTSISVVPFVTYNCHVFDTRFWSIQPHDPIYKLTKLNSSNFSLIERSFQRVLERNFTNIAMPHIHAIKELISRGVWSVFILHYKEDIIGYYFFRNHEFYYDGGKVFECFASICVRNNDLFVKNVYNCVDYLKQNENLKYLYVENLSNNNILLKHILGEKSSISTIRYNYYFYNNIITPVLSKDTIILN